MMRRTALLCLIAMVLSACSTAPREAPEAPVSGAPSMIERVESTAKLPMAVPEHTVLLGRMDLPEVRGLWQRATSLADASDAPTPSGVNPARMMLAGLLTGPGGVRRGELDPASYADDAFPGLDAEGTVYAAVSMAGNEEALRAMQLGAPVTSDETSYRGFLVRLRLPASDPDALAEWLRKRCKETAPFCGRLVSVEATGASVRIDYRVGDSADAASLESPDDDDAFIAQGSPALDAFIENPAAVGVYMRGERFAAVGALIGLFEVTRAIEGVPASRRDRLFAKGVVQAGDVFDILSPEVREVTDSTTLLRAAGEDGLVVDTVAGLTERGKRVWEAGAGSVRPTRPMAGDAVFELDVAHDVSASRAATTTPTWMQTGPRRDQRQVQYAMRSGGIWSFGVAAHNYPVAFGRGLHTLLLMEGDEEALLALQAEYLNAVSVSVGIEPSDESSLGVMPVGGVTLSFDRRSDIDGWTGLIEALLEDEFDVPLTVTAQTLEDRKELMIRFGDSVSEAKSGPMQGIARAELDLERMVEALRDVPDNEKGSGVKMAMPAIEDLGRMSARSRQIEGIVHTRLAVGDVQTSLRLPKGLDALAQPEPASHCVGRARTISGEAFDAFETATPENREKILMRSVELLAELEPTCEEHADDVRWARARWMQFLGTSRAQSLDWKGAAEFFEQGCELGDAADCELLKKARKGLRVELPTMSTNVRLPSWGAYAGALIELTPESVSRWTFAVSAEAGDAPVVSLEGVDPDAEDLSDELDSLAQSLLSDRPYVAADVEASAYLLARLNMVEREDRRRRRRMAIKGPPERRDGVYVGARKGGDGELVGVSFHMPEPDSPLEWRMAIGEDTIDITRMTDDGAEPVAPVDGCPSNGPTLCESADLSALASLPVFEKPNGRVAHFVGIDFVVDRQVTVGRLVEVADEAITLVEETGASSTFTLSPAD